MSTLKRLLSFERINRLLFRPLFMFLTFLLVLMAIFQVSGRVMMATLDVFEDEVNAALRSQDIRLEGLSAGWRGLNPVITVQRLALPAGEATEFEFELDVLESMWRSAIVARRLDVDLLRLFAEREAGVWRLRGFGAQESPIDLVQLITHSDQIDARVELRLQREQNTTDVVTAAVDVVNHGGLHFANLILGNADNQDQLILRAWQREAVWPLRQEGWAIQVGGRWLIPQGLVDVKGLTVDVPDGVYREERGQGNGHLEMALRGLPLPTGELSADVAVSLTLARQAQSWRSRIDTLRLELPAHQMDLGPVYAHGRLPAGPPAGLEAAARLIGLQNLNPLVSIWLEELDLSALSDYGMLYLAEWEPAGSWIEALAVRGEAHNVHAFYDPEQGSGFMASLADVSLQGYKGVPTIDRVQGQLWGHEHNVVMQLRGEQTFLAFPDIYRSGWSLDSLQGVVKVWFGAGHFGVRGSHLRASVEGTNAGGEFSITRPADKYEQRLSLQVTADQVSTAFGKTLVPQKSPKGLIDWLDTGVIAGRMYDARFALHGHVRPAPGDLGRRIELSARLVDGRVAYLPDWPEVTAVDAQIHVAGAQTRIELERGMTHQIRLSDSRVVLHENAAYATGRLNTVADASAALSFIRNSPLRENMPFVTSAWQGSGQLEVSGFLQIPISATAQQALAVDLSLQTDDLSLAMPEYRVVVHQLNGVGQFQLPHLLSGRFTAELFNRPAVVEVTHNDDWLMFDIEGKATPADVYGLLDTETVVPIKGAFDFDSTLNIAATDGITNLSVNSDLEGLTIDLPGEFHKAETATVLADLNVQFLEGYQSVGWRYREVSGWLHYGEEIERGALGIRVPPPMTAQAERAIVIAGRMPELILEDWVSGSGESAVSLPLDWRIQNLQVDRFTMDEMSFDQLVLGGAQVGAQVSFDFEGPTLRGAVVLPEQGPMTVDLDYLELPASDESEGTGSNTAQVDPTTTEVGESLPAARVVIKQLQLGDEPFGAWRFNIEPDIDRVAFTDFNADVNGLHIFDSRLEWDLRRDVTDFIGQIRMDDLAQTLPKWDYAPTLSTDKARIKGAGQWDGSPLNVHLLGTRGQLDFEARDGRFIDLENSGGGLRILGLLNFTKVAKRISFDFSDIAGDGLSFETIDAKVDLNAGALTFPERMTVETSSGDFEIGGRVDLREGLLDNEMIVTLPVSKSLPWYGVYLALANPLAGLGVLVGERVLRRPMEQFSTAKFEVKGSLEEPVVRFVSLWDKSMKDINTDASTRAEKQQASASGPDAQDAMPGLSEDEIQAVLPDPAS